MQAQITGDDEPAADDENDDGPAGLGAVGAARTG